MEPILELRGIEKRFGATLALRGVDLTVFPGEIQALVGENGSGKSTLMRVISGAIKADAGSLTFAGKPYAPSGPAHARDLGIAMIYQELTLCPHLSVLDNLMLGLEPVTAGVLRRSEALTRAREALGPLGLADIDLDSPAGQFSLATQQLIEIGRAAVQNAKLVILDEPTSSLAEHDVRRLFEVIGTLKARGCGVIYISHFLNEVRELADRVTVLRDGSLIGSQPLAELTDNQIVSMMVGRPIEDLYPRSERKPGEVILELEGLVGRKLPKQASLQLRRGEVLGIAGLIGSGRTELLRLIFGLDPVARGAIKVGAVSGVQGPNARWEQGLGFLSEDRKGEGLALKLPISENMALSSLPGGLIDQRAIDSKSREWITKLSVKCQGPEQAVGELSGGNQQKVALARLLYHGVDVLLLDEPTRGIDVGSKEQIYRMIDECARQNCAVLFVSSYLPELLGVCDRIAVMSRGVLNAPREVAGLTQEELLAEAVGI